MAQQGLTPEQLETYASEGVVRLPGAVAAAEVAAMRDVLWRRLEARCGARRDRPETWSPERPAQLTSKADEFTAMASPTVRAVLDQLLGRWKTPPRWGIPLVTFPTPAAWDVPHLHWHTDLPVTAAAPSVARVFLLLAPLAAQGGGTGYIAGSHRVLRLLAQRTGRTLPSGVARRMLKEREPWFAALESRREDEDRIERFMVVGGVADGVPVRVAEMTGEPGDVFMMDPIMLHGMTRNAAPAPRLMLTEWVYASK